MSGEQWLSGHGWLHGLCLVLLHALHWCCLTQAPCAKLLTALGASNCSLSLAQGLRLHMTQLNHGSSWDVPFTWPLTMSLTMQQAPSSSFTPGLACLSVEER